MDITRRLAQTLQHANSAVGHDEFELVGRAAESDQAVMRAAAVHMHVVFEFAYRADEAPRQQLRQDELGRVLRLSAELHPSHGLFFARVSAGQDGTKPALGIAAVFAHRAARIA